MGTLPQPRASRAKVVFAVRSRYFIYILVLIVTFGTAAVAQNTVTGAFQGDVSNDRTGDALPGVAVQIISVQSGATYDLVTDSQGVFYQGLLAPGFYDIRVSLPGFKEKLLRREIKVSLTGDIVPVPVSLEPEIPGAAVAPAILEESNDVRVEMNTIDARREGSKKLDEIQVLPIGSSAITRSFDEMATLLPGVVPPPQTIGDVTGPGVGPGVGSAGQFAVNGIRSRANNFTVDGSDNNDEDIGVRRQGFIALVPQPIESIQEFQITTLLAPAQFGRNIGAQVNAVSRAGANVLNASLFGTLNSRALNARGYFDSDRPNGQAPVRSASGQAVVLDGQPINSNYGAGNEDSLTYAQGGFTLGGKFIKDRSFFFLSGEFQKINAAREKSFAVPTIEQRGAFGTGATGTYRDPYTGAAVSAIPNTEAGGALFSLFPFPNDPNGVYGANTYSQVLPAGGRGVILSGRVDNNFDWLDRQNVLTARYNFTDDDKAIPAVNEALFSSVRSKIRTHNLSLFLNSQLDRSDVGRKRLFNQIRFSYGNSDLSFDEIRDQTHLIPSRPFPNIPFLLNAPLRFNITQPAVAGTPNSGPVLHSSFDPFAPTRTIAEDLLGPIGQVSIAGFSTLGTDVYNFPQDRINRTFQLADELIYRTGGHSLIFGADVRRTDLKSDLPRLNRPMLSFSGAPRLTPSGGGSCPNGGIANYCFPDAGSPSAVILPIDLAGLGAASNFVLTFNVDRPDSRVDLRYYQLNFYAQDTWRLRNDLSLSYGLRYEYNTPVRETNSLIEQTFSDTRLDLVPGIKAFIDGRKKIFEPDKNNFGPRVAIAYSPELFGRQKVSVFRAGYGLFYDQILGAVVNQSRNVFPSYLTVNLGGLNVFGSGLLNLTNPAALAYGISGTNVPVSLPGTINQFNPAIRLNDFIRSINFIYPNAIGATLPTRELEMPMAHHYSVSFEQQLNQNLTVSAAYVGTSGRKLLRFTTPNLGPGLTTSPTELITSPVPTPFGTLFLPQNRGVTFRPARPIAAVGSVEQFETTGSSRYDSLQTQIRARFLHSLNFQASYTFSKVTDDVSDVFDLAGAYVLPQNSFDLKAERGAANFDVRHRAAYDLIYEFGRSEGTGFISELTNGLTVSTTGRLRTGQPFTVNSAIDVNLDGNLTDRLDNLNGIRQTGDRSRPIELTTSDTTSLLAPWGQEGRIGRNTFRAGNVIELDLSVVKRFSFSNRGLSIRADIFNFVNRANFGVPVRVLEAPGFGRAVSTITPGRRAQFSIKYDF